MRNRTPVVAVALVGMLMGAAYADPGPDEFLLPVNEVNAPTLAFAECSVEFTPGEEGSCTATFIWDGPSPWYRWHLDIHETLNFEATTTWTWRGSAGGLTVRFACDHAASSDATDDYLDTCTQNSGTFRAGTQTLTVTGTVADCGRETCILHGSVRFVEEPLVHL